MGTKGIYIAAAVLLIGGGAYVAVKKDGKQAAETVSEGAVQEQAAGDERNIDTINGSMEDLLTLDRNVTCTFSYNDEAGAYEGTVYVAGGANKMRGDFSYMTTQDDTTFTGGMIHDGTMLYSWSDTPQGTFGMKMDVSDMEGNDVPEAEEFEGQQFDPNRDIAYECSSWRVDDSMFVPPSGVQFMDYSAQMEAMQGSMQGSGGPDCSMCESIPDESARAECRASLQCE